MNQNNVKCTGVLTHKRNTVAVQKENDITRAFLESIEWEDERSFEVGATNQGTGMLVVGGFPFVKNVVNIRN